MKLLAVLQIFLLFGHHYGYVLQDIPDSPTLPDLDYDSLPGFIRGLLPEDLTRRSSPHITEKKKVKGIKNTKTYGMVLNGDHGVVWNDLVGPKTRYQVGNEKNFKAQQDVDAIIENMLNNINVPTTSKPDDFQKTTPGDLATTERPTTPKVPEAEVPKTPEPTEIKKTDKDLLKELEKKTDALLTDLVDKIKFPHKNEKDEDIVKDTAVIEGNNQGRRPHKPQPGTSPSILELLLQNDDIWSWLDSYSAKYLDIIMSKLGAVVQEEVQLLIQSYFEKNPCQTCQNNEKESNNTEESAHKYDPSNLYEKNTIYGNSVGNEKVTNVFIFNMNKTGQPIINSNNSSGSFVIDFDKNPNESDESQDNTEKDNNEGKGESEGTESSDKDNEITTENDDDSKVTTEQSDKDSELTTEANDIDTGIAGNDNNSEVTEANATDPEINVGNDNISEVTTEEVSTEEVDVNGDTETTESSVDEDNTEQSENSQEDDDKNVTLDQEKADADTDDSQVESETANDDENPAEE